MEQSLFEKMRRDTFSLLIPPPVMESEDSYSVHKLSHLVTMVNRLNLAHAF
jgi:hypothetical protein